MKRVSLALSAIVIVGLSPACECRAQSNQPNSGPAAMPAPAPISTAAPAAPAPAVAPAATPGRAGQRCLQYTNSENIPNFKVALENVNAGLRSPTAHLTGPNLEGASYFMPAGGLFRVAVNEAFDPNRRYFGYVEDHVEPTSTKDVNMYGFIEGRAIGAVQIQDDDPLVKSKLVDPATTLLTLRVPDSIGGFWNTVDLYIWTCEGVSPKYRSSLTTRASSWYAGMVIWPVVLLVYFLAALATKRTDVKTGVPLVRYFDPVYMTAGSDGKGSLSKLQILFFSLIVFGLLSYIVARTGVLSDLSSSILLLLGIAGVGSTAAKGADDQKNRLSFENRAWLIRKGWLPPAGWAAVNKASWHDIITNDGGEFDVYRYQSCIFSLTVGGALLVGGVNELASFTIPQTLLGVLGLSQVVYIGGKLVTKSSVAELDDAVAKARTSEKDLTGTSAAKSDLTAGIASSRAEQSSYPDYMIKATDAKIAFEALTGQKISDDKLKPTVTI